MDDVSVGNDLIDIASHVNKRACDDCVEGRSGVTRPVAINQHIDKRWFVKLLGLGEL